MSRPYINHTNEFLLMNGRPFIVGEYADNMPMAQLDRSRVRSEIIVDQSEAYRAIIDISIDSIGKKSDGTMNIIGNKTKSADLLNIIRDQWRQLDHQLPLLKKGLVLRINYQLENNRTGQVLRTLIEDLRIPQRDYYIDINPDDINDNAIVVNFADTIVSTINQFTHGSDPMILRITSIQMCYECVLPDPIATNVPSYCDPNVPHWSEYSPNAFESRAATWEHHVNEQNVYNLGDGRVDPYPNIPRPWIMYNRFYHYDDCSKNFILHEQEIDHIHNKTVLYACGKVHVNRAFLVNPGHRVIFKFSIWKNDIVLQNDCSEIAKALNIYPTPVVPPCPPPCPRQNPANPCTATACPYQTTPMECSVQKCPYPPVVNPIPEIIDPYPYPVPRPPRRRKTQSKTINMLLELIKGLNQKIDGEVDPDEDPITDEEMQAIIDDLDADWEDDHEYNRSNHRKKHHCHKHHCCKEDEPEEDDPEEDDPENPENPGEDDPENPENPGEDDPENPGEDDPEGESDINFPGGGGIEDGKDYGP